MTDRRHPDQVARYLDGTLSPSDRTVFEERLARDGGLRMQVDAERAIRATIERDVATMPDDHGATRAGMLAALAALPTPPASTPTSTPGSSAPTPSAPISPLLRWLGIAGAGTAVFIGAWLVSDIADRPSSVADTTATSDSTARAPLDARRSDSAVDLDSPTEIGTRENGTGENGTGAGSAEASDVRAGGAGVEAGRVGTPASATATEGASANGSTTTRGDADARDTRDGRAPDAETPAVREQSTPATTTAPPKKLRVIEGDSVRVRVGVEDVRRKP